MKSGFEWVVTPEDAFAGLVDVYTQAVRRAVITVVFKRAPEIEAWMKENAVWQDQTGNARQTLWSEPFVDAMVIGITFGHGMDYGWWLEMANAGRFSIILPALDHWSSIIMQDMNEIVGR